VQPDRKQERDAAGTYAYADGDPFNDFYPTGSFTVKANEGLHQLRDLMRCGLVRIPHPSLQLLRRRINR
jgi:hypothetical protein